MHPRAVLATFVVATQLSIPSASLFLTTNVYKQSTLPSGLIYEEMARATRTCECRSRCAELGCRTYSVTELGSTDFLCQFSISHVPLVDLQPQLPGTKSYVVYKSDYKHYGNNFYRIETDNQTNRHATKKQCLSEGGQLAVANTPELMTELEQAMMGAGVRLAWVGLYRNTTDPGTTPYWQFNNGTVIEQADAVIQQINNRCYVVDLDASVTNRLHNEHSCFAVFPPTCQRSY